MTRHRPAAAGAVVGGTPPLPSPRKLRRHRRRPRKRNSPGRSRSTRSGRLGNWTTGSVLHPRNNKPEKRAELRLVVNAGSILEDDDQLGLAHFVEHTAFNGTTHFKKNDLVNYLQSIGVRFGADLNAYTGFDETVYILPVPTDTARIVETGVHDPRGLGHGQVFDSTEVDERARRRARGVAADAKARAIACCTSGCRSPSRAPGTPSACRSATSRASCRRRRRGFARFYKNWYRPDLMAVVAVGDFDVGADRDADQEALQRDPQGRQRAQATPPDVPTNKEPLIAIASDKEAPARTSS